jgi:hypothetical protein
MKNNMKHKDFWLEQILREPKGNAINSPDNGTNKGKNGRLFCCRMN